MVSMNKKTTPHDKEKAIEFQHKQGRWSRVARRGVHLTSSALIIYFFFPEIVFEIGAFRMHRALFLVLLFFLIPFQIEFWRLSKGKSFFMLREHEKNCVAAYIWTLVGSMALCLLTEVGLPEFIAIPTMLCASLGDPFLGETRVMAVFRRRHYYSLAVLLCGSLYFIWLGNPFLALGAGFLTVIAESLNIKLNWGLRKEMLQGLENKTFILRKIKALNLYNRLFYTNDNLLMQMIPLFFLVILYLALPQFFPPDSMFFGDWWADIIAKYQFGTFFRI